jgi:hypothetical protein
MDVGVSVGPGVSVDAKTAFCVESAWIVLTRAVAVNPASGAVVAVGVLVATLHALISRISSK